MKTSWRFLSLLFVCLSVAACEYLELFDPDPTTSITLAWDAPTANADGTPLSDLSGFRIYYGNTSPLTPENSTTIDVANGTTHTIPDLDPGTYFFAVSALDLNGNESELSEETSTEIPAQ
jgi:hypothetical protein